MKDYRDFEEILASDDYKLALEQVMTKAEARLFAEEVESKRPGNAVAAAYIAYEMGGFQLKTYHEWLFSDDA